MKHQTMSMSIVFACYDAGMRAGHAATEGMPSGPERDGAFNGAFDRAWMVKLRELDPVDYARQKAADMASPYWHYHQCKYAD